MNTLKVFISAFCVGSIALGVLYILVPKGNLSKSVRYTFCLCLLCTVLSAAANILGGDFPQLTENARDFSNDSLSVAAARLTFEAALTRENIKFSEINVFTDKTDSGGISITKVLVYTHCSFSEVNAVIGSNLYELVVINE